MKNVYLVTLTNRFYILCFFHLVRRDSAGLWTLTLLQIHELYCRLLFFVFFYFHMRMKVCVRVCVCMHSFALTRATNTHIWWIWMGWSSELCRALAESSFEMYIQCEGLKWFLLNSIFYRFCRHFVVGRKKNKRNFMGAFLSHIFLWHTYTFYFSQWWNSFSLGTFMHNVYVYLNNNICLCLHIKLFIEKVQTVVDKKRSITVFPMMIHEVQITYTNLFFHKNNLQTSSFQTVFT